MAASDTTQPAGYRDEIFNALSAAGKELDAEQQLEFALALVVVLSDCVGDKKKVQDAIAKARRSV